MGKIRQKRHAFHTAAPKLEGNETASNQQSSAETLLRPITTSNLDVPFPDVTSNIFGNVHIAPELLNQKLVPVVPTQREKRRQRAILRREKQGSLQTEFKEMLMANKKLKKKDRQPINSVFKVSSLSAERKDELKKRVGVTHMESLMDALTAEEPQDQKRTIKRKRRAAKPFKTQAKEMTEDVNTFFQIMKNPEFTSDPFATISTHLKMKLEAERQNTH